MYRQALFLLALVFLSTSVRSKPLEAAESEPKPAAADAAPAAEKDAGTNDAAAGGGDETAPGDEGTGGGEEPAPGDEGTDGGEEPAPGDEGTGGGEGTNDEKPTETNDETGGGEGTNDEKPAETPNDETGGETDVTNADNGDSADGAAVPHAAEQKIDEAIQKMNQLNDLFESIVQSLGGHTTTDTDDEANTAIKDTPLQTL